MDFGLLGPLLVRDGGRPVVVSAPRQRVLLATLLLSAGRVVSADALAETLWDGRPPAGGRGALHSGVQRLRAKLGPAGSELIVTRSPGYVLQLGEGDFDVRRFEVLAARGEAAAAAGGWAQAAALLREALGLWRGEALADVPSRLLREREVPALEDARLRVLGARIGADLQLGRHDQVAAELRQLVAAWPLREDFHARLMLALYRGGRQGETLAAYQDARRTLAAELGIDPGPELQGLHQQILAADPGLVVISGGQPPGVPRQLPTAARHFAGRAGALKVLADLVGEAAGAGQAGGTGEVGWASGADRAVVISAIEGTAGIGKTTLAVQFAHQVAGRFPDGQLYVNLRGFDPAAPPMDPGEAIRIFLDALGVRAEDPGQPGWSGGPVPAASAAASLAASAPDHRWARLRRPGRAHRPHIRIADRAVRCSEMHWFGHDEPSQNVAVAQRSEIPYLPPLPREGRPCDQCQPLADDDHRRQNSAGRRTEEFRYHTNANGSYVSLG